MRYAAAVTTGVLFLLCAVPSLAEDLNSPGWRTDPPGQETTTYQAWEFGTDDNPVNPDVDLNAFGTAVASLTGSFPVTRWHAAHEGRTGVWQFDDYILLDVPNSPEPNEYKDIWIQLTFLAEEGADPEILSQPYASEVEIVDHVQLSDTWIHGTYRVRIEPNPASELVYIMPRDCTLFVDEIVVDTICIPEPASLALLVCGALVWRRR